MVRGQNEYLMYPKTHREYVEGLENTMNSLQNLSNPPSPKTSLFHFSLPFHKGVASEIKSRFDYYLQIKFTFLLNIDARNVFLCMLN